MRSTGMTENGSRNMTTSCHDISRIHESWSSMGIACPRTYHPDLPGLGAQTGTRHPLHQAFWSAWTLYSRHQLCPAYESASASWQQCGPCLACYPDIISVLDAGKQLVRLQCLTKYMNRMCQPAALHPFNLSSSVLSALLRLRP